MRSTSVWAVFVLLIAGTLAIGQKGKVLPPEPAATPPVVEKTDPVVEQLLKDLGSDDYRTREKAGRDLVARGEKALPSMRAALRATDNPEVQQRLAVMVRKMDRDRLVTPKWVTLTVKDKPAKETLDEISKQTGYKIEYSGNGGVESRLTLEFEKIPFWQAVDRVATAAGCVVVADYNNDETIRVYNQDSLNPYVAYAGPFRFLATNINSSKNVQLSGISRRGGGFGVNRYEYVNLNFQIQSEPKNPMLGLSQVEAIAAVDEFGGSLVPPKDPNTIRSNYYNGGSFRGHNTYGNLNLNRGDKSATTIKTLKAKVGIVLLSGTAIEIAIDDPLTVKNKTFAGRTVEIEYGGLTEDANNKGNYLLELTAKKLGGSDPTREDFNWSNSIWQKIDLLDAAGNRYRCSAPNVIENNGATVQLSLPFNATDRRTGQAVKLGPPVKLLVNEWLSVTHEVTFEFKDIPLP